LDFNMCTKNSSEAKMTLTEALLAAGLWILPDDGAEAGLWGF